MRFRYLVASLAVVLVVAACADTSQEHAPSAAEENNDLSTGPYDPSAEIQPELLRAEPATVSPGESVELHFPEETDRGLGFVLEQARGDTWELRYYLVADSKVEGAGQWWTPEDAEGRGWDDVGIAGPGPDFIEIPETAETGNYRVCTASRVDGFCALIDVDS